MVVVGAPTRSNGYLDALRITSTTVGCASSVLPMWQSKEFPMTTGVWIGIDVSMPRLDYCCGSAGTPAHVPNTPAGYRRLLRRLRPLEIAGIVLESTGAYHLQLTEALQDAGLPVAVITPQLVKWYRDSFGHKAKTDPADARLLAAFGEARSPRPARVPTANERVLRELVARRDDLVVQIGAEKNRIQVARDARIRRHIAAAITAAEQRSSRRSWT